MFRSSQYALPVKSQVCLVYTPQLERWSLSLWPQTYGWHIGPWPPYGAFGDGGLAGDEKGTWGWHGVALSHWMEGFVIADRSWLPPFCLRGCGDRAAVYDPGNEPQSGNGLAWTLILYFPGLRSVKINAWCQSHPVCGLVGPLYLQVPVSDFNQLQIKTIWKKLFIYTEHIQTSLLSWFSKQYKNYLHSICKF